MFSLAPGGAPGAGAAARARRRAMDRVVHQRAATPVALHVRERRDCSARSRRTAREAAARNPPSRGTARRTASPSSPARIWNRCLSPLAPTVLPPAHDVRRWGRLRLLESRENQLHGNPRRCGPVPGKAEHSSATLASSRTPPPPQRAAKIIDTGRGAIKMLRPRASLWAILRKSNANLSWAPTNAVTVSGVASWALRCGGEGPPGNCQPVLTSGPWTSQPLAEVYPFWPTDVVPRLLRRCCEPQQYRCLLQLHANSLISHPIIAFCNNVPLRFTTGPMCARKRDFLSA